LSLSAAVSDSLPYWVANAGNGDTIQFAANLKGYLYCGLALAQTATRLSR
jgi:hypothetical protein